jgi:hypothetical protein
MPELPCDSYFLHLRDTVFLDQDLIDGISARTTGDVTGALTIVARQIVLSGAVIVDRDVVLVADTVSSGVAGLAPVTLRHGTVADPGIVTTAGQIEPPIEVQGIAPRPGAPGHTLTVLCRTLIDGGAESHGQQGGQGLRGKNETRSWCKQHFNPIPELDPCSNADPSDFPEMIGSKGGKGLPGAVGGPAGPSPCAA